MVLELFKLIVSSCLNFGSLQFSRNWSISPQELNVCAFKELRHMSRVLWRMLQEVPQWALLPVIHTLVLFPHTLHQSWLVCVTENARSENHVLSDSRF